MQGASRESLGSLRDALRDSASTDAQTVSDELFAVVSLLTDQGSLRRALADPGIEADAKQRLVDNLLRGKISDPSLDLVRRVARSRWSEPRDVVDALEAVAVDAAMTQAEADGQLDEVEDELFRVQRIIDGEPSLRAALTNRNLPSDRKQQLVHRLLDGKAADVTVALVERAVLHPRGRTIERVLNEFTAFAAQRRSRLIARVTSAVALSEQQQDQLASALASEFGHEVRLQLVVDPAIIGGITVRVGDELLDASVLRQLDGARRHLTGRSGGRV
ncbi:MAG TPA: F0F1 ATP synthase subunit delta [Mycobacteriales bacterium]|nr:F0F1 ATP synthase subunit delta [Mycobacteriales bacterium]